jgi:hypothetical protein
MPGLKFIITEHVKMEITKDDQLKQIKEAIKDDCISVEVITDPEDIQEDAELNKVLGKGEAASRLGRDRIITTSDLVVRAIEASVISVN